jgi:hypothetical protein
MNFFSIYSDQVLTVTGHAATMIKFYKLVHIDPSQPGSFTDFEFPPGVDKHDISFFDGLASAEVDLYRFRARFSIKNDPVVCLPKVIAYYFPTLKITFGGCLFIITLAYTR